MDPHYNLSNIYYKQKRYDLIIEICEKILQENPNEEQAKVNYKHILQKVKNHDEVLFQYHNIFIESENKTYLYILSHALFLIKEYNFSLDVYKKISNLYEDSALLLGNMGAIYMKLKEYNNAKKMFEQVMEKEITHIEVYLNILEYKLVFKKDIDNEYMQRCEYFFEENNHPIILLDMFKVLFHVVNGIDADELLLAFKDKYQNNIIKYDFDDLLDLVNTFEIKSLEKSLEFFSAFHLS